MSELRRTLKINGFTYRLAVNQYGSGAPSASTPGKPAVLYMDIDNGNLYKCTSADVATGRYTWKPISEGNAGDTNVYILSEGETLDDVPADALLVIDPRGTFSGGITHTWKGSVLTITSSSGTSSADLRGPKGNDGTMVFEDLTEEQRESLRGPKGDPLTFDDLTEEQRESLRGPKGDPLTFEDLTEAQRESLRGPKGDDYVLTEADKTEMVQTVLAALPIAEEASF